MISTIASLVASTPLNANVPSPAAIDLNTTTTTNYFYTTIDSQNRSSAEQNDTDSPVFPAYIRNTSVVFCVVIMCLGVIGNIMVPIVIFKSKDMRNSTNIFLVNLSVADLMVLLVCTPTVLVEVNSKPETWVLGETMCKAVPFVEMTVAHASVLTILAISFERYYAICKPLKAGYVCTKTRASLICLLAWFFAAVFTSPILSIAEFKHVEYFDRTSVPACHTLANSFWSALYFLMTIFIFFIIPLILLLIIYAIIAKNLISDAAKIVLNKHIDNYSIRARRQVVLMLGTVVLSFFLCLIPFRVFTVWIILVSDETVNRLGIETYYNILYFCRIMVYLNSVVNPILYNLMSSKFREGFLLCSKNRKLYFRRSRNGTLSTTVNSYRSSTFRSQGSFRTRHQSMVLKNVSDSPDSNRSNDSRTKIFTESLRSNLEGSKHLEPPERGRLDSVEIQHLDTIELSENRGSKILEPFLKHEIIEIQHVNLKRSNELLDHVGSLDFRSNFEQSVLQCSSNEYNSSYVMDNFKKSNSSKTLELLECKTYDRSKLDAIEIQHLAPLDEGDLKFLNIHLDPISLEPAVRELGEFSSNVLRINQFENQNKILKTSKHKSNSTKMLTTIENLKTFEEDLYLNEMFKNKNPNMESESFV